LIVTSRALVEPIREQLAELPPEAVLGEPAKRDTAACIGLAAFQVLRNDPEATMVVMPADHVIAPREKLQAAIRYAVELVDQQPSRLVTFGVKPTYPAESFGYIERGRLLAKNGAAPAYAVNRFREKPDAATAKQFLDAGNFYWNSGIFVWRAATIVEALAANQPAMHRRLQTIADATGTSGYQQILDPEFAAIQGVSIDYAVMEHAKEIVVIEAPFDWDDLGSWLALARVRGVDENRNTIAAKHVGLDTQGTIVRSTDGHLLVTLGVEDLIIVHTPDATLVANRHREEDIRKIVSMLEKKGWDEYL
jgi:mannose-1-phosphate guanylyltransferase